MNFILSIDWAQLLIPTISPLEGILRVSVVYLFLFLLIRVLLKREAGQLGITDLLVIVLIADAAQNAMAADYRSITDGLVLVTTLVLWDWGLDYAAMRWKRIRRIVRPVPLLLVRDGKPIWHNLRKELLTEEELASYLRLEGIERVEDVKYAFMEMDGRISAIPKKEEDKGKGAPEKKGI